MAITPNPKVLDDEFLGRQRASLREERDARGRVVETLASEINGLVHRREAGGPAEEGFGRGEAASVDLEETRARHAEVVARLVEVDGAFARLEAGAYGRCEVCGGSIGEARLEAIPTAIRCIGCQAGRVRQPLR